ncbi:hypothetical protein NEOLEDRAFT_1184566 [Neolentinus lepideus HHB14362 ss-1]|uniref:FAD-binding domain-containing protein n=1 Tax=Neolentinus lepideus HHB14362 ss-1 TaxID=1314782 RepID=A0A165MAY7_9AGAM|nr:hypothetical protein NEOLEDRAFT_1184566 [Neolentinus lepideus HHB14362 ss-1]
MELCDGALRLNGVEDADFPEWIHPAAPIVLTGDAAHPFTGASLSPSSTAVEDAACLEQLFSYITRRNQLLSLTSVFRENRQLRVRESEEFMVRQQLILDAPEEMLNSVESAWQGMGIATQETLGNSSVCDDLLEVFADEAEDAASDWWIAVRT